jgi:hypothetical protein
MYVCIHLCVHAQIHICNYVRCIIVILSNDQKMMAVFVCLHLFETSIISFYTFVVDLVLEKRRMKDKSRPTRILSSERLRCFQSFLTLLHTYTFQMAHLLPLSSPLRWSNFCCFFLPLDLEVFYGLDTQVSFSSGS